MSAGELFSNPMVIILGAIASLMMTIYLAQEILIPMIRNIRRTAQKNPEERAAEMMDQYMRREVELDRETRDTAMGAPQIRMLRIGRTHSDTTCLFINAGGTATDLDVTPIGPFAATVTPRETLKNGETGRVVIHDAKTSLLLMQFRLSYIDPYAQRISRLYAFSEKESRFKEI